MGRKRYKENEVVNGCMKIEGVQIKKEWKKKERRLKAKSMS